MVFNKNIKKEVKIHSLQQAVKRNACICHFWTLRKMVIPQRCIKHLLKPNTTLQHKTTQTGGIPCYCHLSTFKALGIVVAVVRVFLCLVVSEMQDMDLLECYCAKFIILNVQRNTKIIWNCIFICRHPLEARKLSWQSKEFCCYWNSLLSCSQYQ